MQISITLPAFLLLAIVCAAVSAATAFAIGLVFAKHFARKMNAQITTGRQKDGPSEADALRIEQVNCFVGLVNKENGTIEVRQQISTSGAQVTSSFVENWLAERNLVMMPKSTDFKVSKQAPATKS